MSPAGDIVARGHIRVDARRAIAKLRENLLVDLHAYLLEMVRSAVVAGATGIDIRYDADDLYLRFDGVPFASCDLGRLLDFAVDEVRGVTSSPLRLLALGVNAALGLGPAYVDVYTSDEGVMRTRFHPEFLEGEGTGASSVPVTSRAAPPDGRGVAATCVHLRRRLAWSTVRRAVSGGGPPEIDLIAPATRHLSIPLQVNGKPVGRNDEPRPVLRVAMEGLPRAELHVLAGGAAQVQLEFLEHGVKMLAVPFPIPYRGPCFGVHLPVRAFIDSAALPTNASRSTLREDSGLAEQADAALRLALRDAMAALLGLLTGQGERPRSVEVLHPDPVSVENALGAFACVAQHAAQAGHALPPELGAVLALPLFRDGIGRGRAASHVLSSAAAGPLYAHRGDAALSADFGPWMTSVLWLRGRTVERMLDNADVRDLSLILDRIRQGVQRRNRLLAHPASGPFIPKESEELVREVFAFDVGPAKGLRGEVCVRLADPAEGAKPSAPRVRAFVEDRLIETFDLDERYIALPLEMAIAWEGRVVPTASYDGVQRNADLRTACWEAVKLGVLGLGRVVGMLPSLDAAQADWVRTLLRAASAAVPEAAPAAGIDRAPIWPTTDGRFASLGELVAYARQTGAVCYVRNSHATARGGAAIDGRPVVVSGEPDLHQLQAAVGAAVVLVPYEAGIERAPRVREAPMSPALRGALEKELRRQGAEGAPLMPFSKTGCRGWMAATIAPVLVRLHAGVPLPPQARAAGFATIAVDEDSIVPTSTWDGVLFPTQPPDLDDVERALFRNVVAAVAGDAQAASALTSDIATLSLQRNSGLGSYLLQTAARFRNLDSPTESKPPGAPPCWQDIQQLPLLTWLDEEGNPASATPAQVDAHHGPRARIPVLAAAPGFATFDWKPLIAAGNDRDAVEAWLPGRLRDTTGELPERAALAEARDAHRKLMAAPAVDPKSPGPKAAHGLPSVFCEPPASDPQAQGISVCVAPLAPGYQRRDAWVQVLFGEHPLCELALPDVGVPVAARVNVTSSDHVRAWTELSDAGRAAVTTSVQAAIEPLGNALLGAAAGPAASNPLFSNLAALQVLAALIETQAVARISLGVLWRNVRCPTVQGQDKPWRELLQKDGLVLPFGAERYAGWIGPSRRASALDQPILLLPATPEGGCLRRILQGLGYQLEDATDTLKKLQARRRVDGGAPPRLPGSPVHALLRADLATLGVEGAEGELEIIEGPQSDISLVDFDGTARALPADLPVAVRAVVLPSGLGDSREGHKRVVLSMARRAIQHLARLAPHLDELPDFVRSHLRAVVCGKLRKDKKPSKAELQAPVFVDIRGGFHTLEALRAKSGLVFHTSFEPPYPYRDYEAIVLRLSEGERAALATSLRLEDLTELLRKDLEGERRAIAPQIPAEIAAEMAQRCIQVTAIDDDGTVGQIGLLAPGFADVRGIQILAGHRPLCEIEDGSGWPLRACVNDASARPNRFHDALEDDTLAGPIRKKVRAAAAVALETLIAPPGNALAFRMLDGVVIGSAIVTGSLWLPAAWPAVPEVRVWSSGAGATTRPLYGGEHRALDLSLPLGGSLLVLRPGGDPGDAEWQALGRVALGEANAMLLQVVRKKLSPELLAPYRWTLALIGNQPGELTAATVSGAKVNARDIRTELSARGCLWVAERAGPVDAAAFSGPPPAFVLLDEGGPLLRVLRAKAPGALRYVGFKEREEAMAAPPALDGGDSSREQDATRASSSGETTVLESLKRRIAKAWRADTERADPVDPLRQALEKAIRRLPASPSMELEYATRGRPVRFDARKGRLLINRAHATVSRLVGVPDPRMHKILVAAVLSEVNRELEAVTDAEEKRALLQLLAER